jgi:hypothetical protein
LNRGKRNDQMRKSFFSGQTKKGEGGGFGLSALKKKHNIFFFRKQKDNKIRSKSLKNLKVFLRHLKAKSQRKMVVGPLKWG